MLKRLILLPVIWTLLAVAGNADVVYLVGGSGKSGKAVGSLTKAFQSAATDLSSGSVTVRIKLAAGEYNGDLGSGAYALPTYSNPEASLIIEGGYSPDFSERDPFRTPSRIVTIAQRSAPLWTIGRNSKLKAFIVDGLLFDTQASNAYDERTNSLLPGKSSTHAFIKFDYLETELLAFRNCVFANSANRVMEPLIRAATPQAQIEYSNCIFMNNRIPLKLDSARFRNKPARILVDHCSFLINWAYNPDPDTGTPAVLEIGPKEAASEIVITNNLFYSNFGGAILALQVMPPTVLRNNNFIGNGLLHGQAEPDAVAIVVSAGGRKQPVNVGALGDVPGVQDASGNVSIAPGIGLTLGNVKMVNSADVKAQPTWANEVRSILGMNLRGGKVDIRDYAPKKDYDPNNPPFPSNPQAKRYGAQPANLP